MFAVIAGDQQIHIGGALLIGLGGGLVLWALVVLGLARLFRGKSGRDAAPARLRVRGPARRPHGAYAALVRANRALDDSPAVDHATRITRVYTTQGKGNVFHHVEVAPWRRGEATVTFVVESWFATKAAAGKKIVVTTHAGRFGWEWWDDYRLVP